MQSIKLLPLLVIVALSSMGSIAAATSNTSADSEFKRALGIIHNSQLRLFRDSPAETSDELLRRLEIRAHDLTDHTADNGAQSRLIAMRQLLTETMEGYNDAYANYINPEQLKRYREQRRGNYVGIGLKFRVRKDDYPRVVGSLLGGPLENIDIQPADLILAADETDLKGLRSSEVVKLLKGEENTTVEITLQRGDGEPFKYLATRQPVELHYVRSELLPDNIGYLKISRFGGRTHVRVREHVKKLIDLKARAFVLDLRDNPGGSTRAARDIVSIFSSADVVYFERYVSGKHRNLPRHGKHLTDKPLAVLINGNSMSSSEIVAGAFQAHKRGTIIGSPSYGKGLVQQVFDLKAPLGGAIRSTIAVFGRPDRKLIHGTGVVPDHYLETDADFMFRSTGSLNISAAARAFSRSLLEESIREQRPDEADALIQATDQQLEKATQLLQTQLAQRVSNG